MKRSRQGWIDHCSPKHVTMEDIVEWPCDVEIKLCCLLDSKRSEELLTWKEFVEGCEKLIFRKQREEDGSEETIRGELWHDYDDMAIMEQWWVEPWNKGEDWIELDEHYNFPPFYENQIIPWHHAEPDKRFGWRGPVIRMEDVPVLKQSIVKE